MQIELIPGVVAPLGIAVGLADGQPLSYEGRTPHIAGRPVTHAEIANPLADAVDVAASRVFGGEWPGDLSKVTTLNRRTTTHDRVIKFGLPPWVLVMLGRAAAERHSRAVGYHMLAIASLRDSEDREGARDFIPEITTKTVEVAIDLVRYGYRERGRAPSEIAGRATER